MVPANQLISFVLGKELKLIETRRFRQGYRWFCEKRRLGPEICPKCATPSTRQAGVAWTTVHDEDVRGQPIWLKIKKHRYYCCKCRKPFTEPVAGILPRRRTTQRFRKRVLGDCDKYTNLAKVATEHFCSRTLVGRIFYEQMEIKLRERLTQQWPRVLGIDEHRFKRGRAGFAEFVTMLTDVGRKRIFELAQTKNSKQLLEQVAHIPGRENVELVVLDLSRGYRSFVTDLFPRARLVADKFHVLRLITPALIRERRTIHGHRQDLAIRRQLLRSREKLDYFERCDLDRYLRQHPRLEELYRYKERLHQFYRTKGYHRARWALEKLLEQMKHSELEDIQRLQRTLNQWKEEILEYFRSRFTNAFTEAMNAIAKLVQRRGCGYRSFRNYRIRTLSACPA